MQEDGFDTPPWTVENLDRTGQCHLRIHTLRGVTCLRSQPDRCSLIQTMEAPLKSYVRPDKNSNIIRVWSILAIWESLRRLIVGTSRLYVLIESELGRTTILRRLNYNQASIFSRWCKNLFIYGLKGLDPHGFIHPHP
jgi:hypothetical protein